MFCRDKEATAVATALHSYDYYPRPPRGSRVSPYSRPHSISKVFSYLYFFHKNEREGGVREDRTPLFFKPTDIHSIGFLRFRLFFRMIY